ncbi:MAG TPA: hypothetical protein VFL10_08705 [Ornithinibacter sp.]|nr:hypothetical protein [Ornithinibacter sp.]
MPRAGRSPRPSDTTGGPGGECYLDRLVAAEAGADVGAIDFGDSHPAQSDPYRAMFG